MSSIYSTIMSGNMNKTEFLAMASQRSCTCYELARKMVGPNEQQVGLAQSVCTLKRHMHTECAESTCAAQLYVFIL